MQRDKYSAYKMVNTRNSTASNKEATSVTRPSDVFSDNSDLNIMLETLTEESKSTVKVLSKILDIQLSEKLSTLHKIIAEKDQKIVKLETEVNDLKTKVQELENNIDSVDQYERRDTIILSGSSVPEETTNETTNSVVISAIKDNLKIILNESDISVSHRLGPKRQDRNRPIIVKLNNRSIKHDLVGACVRLRPQLYINESLTPRRRTLFNAVLQIKKTHKPKFQQCYTKDGTIIVKLKNSTVKHAINDEKSLTAFLEKYPEMMDTYRQMTSSR